MSITQDQTWNLGLVEVQTSQSTKEQTVKKTLAATRRMPPERPDTRAQDKHLTILSPINGDSCSFSVNPVVAMATVPPEDDSLDPSSAGSHAQSATWQQTVNSIQARQSMFDKENLTKNADTDSYERFLYGDKDHVNFTVADNFDEHHDVTQNRGSDEIEQTLTKGKQSSLRLMESRKQSTHRFKSMGSIIAHTVPGTGARQSIYGGTIQKKKAKQAPTYRMEPLPGHRINYCHIKDIMGQVTDQALMHMSSYDPLTAGKMIKQIAARIVHRVSHTPCERYKILCHVTLVELTGQGVTAASRHLWHDETDKTATIRRGKRGDKGQFEMIVTVYGVYTE